MLTPTPLLEVANLSVRFPRRYGDVAVLDGVDLQVDEGECMAIVGESGCGKSLLGLAVAGLLPRTARLEGSVRFRGHDIAAMSRAERRALRGSEIGIIYQDALTSLNPGMSVGAQLGQVCRLGAKRSPADLLVDVGLTETDRFMRSKPYQLSGGQRQRVLTAMALAREPRLVVADEPTTALDVTIQAQIIELLQDLRLRFGFSLLFISHDLPLVSQFAQRIAVLYAGQVAEVGTVGDVLSVPRHPYMSGLLAASRSLDGAGDDLTSIPGAVHQPQHFPRGCRFRDRCPRAGEDCGARPRLRSEAGRAVACFHPLSDGDQLRWTTALSDAGPQL